MIFIRFDFRAFFVAVFFTVLLLMMGGCGKDELLKANGEIFNTGSFSSGGCEWVIRIGAEIYQPRNLPASFRTDGMLVEITYRVISPVAECPVPQNFKGRIHLNRIAQI